jgi:hypothetical protein
VTAALLVAGSLSFAAFPSFATTPTLAVVPSPDATIGTPPAVTENDLAAVSAESAGDAWPDFRR